MLVIAMGLYTSIPVTAAVLAFAASSFAQPQTTSYDPYNPQTQRTSVIQPKAPSPMDLGSGTDQGNIGPFVTMPDKQFATALAIRAMMEIPLSQTAADKGSTEAVRQLGRRMIDDYSRWSKNIDRASMWLKITLPADLDAKDRQELSRITDLSGPAFDEAYLKEMVRLQNQALSVTHYEAGNAGVTGFRTWAGIMIPTIQEELRLAKQELKADKSLVSRR
jgi:putative membrane protein